MNDKQNDVFTIGIIAAILLAFACLDLVSITGLLSEEAFPVRKEPVPAFSVRNALNGTYFDELDGYAHDNFYNRGKWSDIVRGSEYLFGKREYEDVYVGKQETFFERHLAEDYEGTPEEKSLSYLVKLTWDYDAKVMLIPTSEEIWKDRLPMYADVFDQSTYLEKVKQRIGDSYIDVSKAFREHANESLYYRSDPHWTSLGAYYAYLTWWEDSGERLRYYYDLDRTVTVTKNYVGPLATQSGFRCKGEEIIAFAETMKNTAQVRYDGGDPVSGYYRAEKLSSGNAYGYFLGDDFEFAVIDTKMQQSKSLFVIGDSWSKCMIPMLAPYYKTIYLIDQEHFGGSVEKMLSIYAGDEGTDVLLLRSVTGFLDDFSLGEERMD